MNSSFSELTVGQLNKAIKIKIKLEALQSELESILGSSSDAPTTGTAKKGKRKMSRAGRAAIAAGQAARWAKVKGDKPAKKGKRTMSAAGRARISAAAKLRWKKAKAAGKTSLKS